jgi:hypothetical protein
MKSLALLVTAAMVVSALPAISSEPTRPMAPGGAAGVQQAQGESNKPIYIAGGVGIAIAIGVLLLTNNNGGGVMVITEPPLTTTATTGP